MAGPLDGIRVADFTWVWAGPTNTMQLAHMGAEVIRMETSQHICTLRMFPPWPDSKPGPNRSGYFNQYNQGKRAILLDLGKDEGAAIAKRIVEISDVAVENFAAGVIDRLGFGYDELRKVNDDIIMMSMSGYGATGPDKDYVSYGPAQVPMSGLSSLTGYKDWQPMHVGMSYGDPTAGLHAAFAVIAALFYRERTGKGQYIDMSQWESSMVVIGEAFMQQVMNGAPPERDGSHDLHMAPHNVYRCAGEDRWIAISCASDEEFGALCGVIGKAELASDARFATITERKANEDALDAEVEAWTSQQEPFEAMEKLQAAGVAAYPPLVNQEVMESPHLAARDFWVEHEHPEVGVRRHAGIPWRFSETPLAVKRAAPVMGQDNEYVFGELLGMGSDEIAGLVEREVIR
ncbi:MAG: CoA transferase [Chloroflexi bacterium]|nr:CoA transferase [Chloroflexota bacterium]MCI0783932.1 CoA transferase [Chloroflexota bacterium]MCI0814273.1 CoA transferase [Chloroflexota bacterium]MCI0817588.1 CoA transferase [Chloroflexota bacterium]MCI0820494.1 CoA transferase [Chloroflexota bacterium]